VVTHCEAAAGMNLVLPGDHAFEKEVSMENENTTHEIAPVVLTDEQTVLVSGGALPVVSYRGGCPGCTSGLQLAFQSLVINPVLPQQQMQAFG
jgi:hypothetical protein